MTSPVKRRRFSGAVSALVPQSTSLSRLLATFAKVKLQTPYKHPIPSDIPSSSEVTVFLWSDL